MTSFKKFSDAAILYAKNADIVNAMYEECRKGIATFLDAIHDELTAMEPNIREQKTPGYRYWWIADPEDQDSKDPKNNHVPVWVGDEETEIISQGVLNLRVGAPSATPPERERIIRAALSGECSKVCSRWNGGSWSLFRALVKYSSDDPARSAAESILLILRPCEAERSKQRREKKG